VAVQLIVCKDLTSDFCSVLSGTSDYTRLPTVVVVVLDVRLNSLLIVNVLQWSWTVWNGSALHSLIHYDCSHVCKWNIFCFLAALVQGALGRCLQ